MKRQGTNFNHMLLIFSIHGPLFKVVFGRNRCPTPANLYESKLVFYSVVAISSLLQFELQQCNLITLLENISPIRFVSINKGINQIGLAI